MSSQEKELEMLVENIDNKDISPVLPVFEMHITLLSLGVAIMLFGYPDMFIGETPQPDLYRYMLWIMPQWGWGFAFLIASLLKSIGLMFDFRILRIIGLVVSIFLYAALSVSYVMSFPSIGTVVFVSMTLFTLVSIPAVKNTSIKKIKREAILNEEN